ncbi:uncharacterized protein LOC129909663 [Episyrphus balteatus]|uniref:uncharacterized protein LOC129909663 n=1 Tax=Episyrphus balteatus TaxID=286459 RepID=UPI002486272D|nr:uncharacterized protein LOC129909663 [Episyrphus balteatus]
MPRSSFKTKFIQLYEQITLNDLWMLELFGENDDKTQEKQDEIIEDLTILMLIAENSRYGAPFLQHSVPKSNMFLENVLPHLDEDRFKQIVRVNWSNFDIILDLIKDDEIFHGPRSCRQLSVKTQLTIVLYRLGSSGEGGSIAKIARLFGIGDGGTIQNITERVFQAILKLKNKYLFWPDAQERKNLALETSNELPHCIGYVDGTEIKLAEKPSEDPEAYFSRKHIYSLKVQAVCDYKLRIRHMVLGYPGSVHDARIYNNCDLFTKEQDFFTGSEWLAGDSAYKLTGTVVTPFRENSVEMTAEKRKNFNRNFSKYRIRIEHCFGLLKERFSSLKELKIQIKNQSGNKLACRWVLVCAILHNIILAQTASEDSFEVQNEANTADIHEESNHESEESNHESVCTVAGQVKRRALVELIHEQNL